VRSRRSSDKTLFVRTHVAVYFFSLLVCNLAQAIGGLFNIPWIVESRVYVGMACTAQAAFKQIGNVRQVFHSYGQGSVLTLSSSQAGTAIFSCAIAAHTFSLLFLRCHWSDCISRTILIVSWAFLFLELCIENFILAEPGRPYYGIAGYWCWITPTYPIERYTTDYLLMLISVAVSFILHLLVFFRLRGNITISAGNKFHFHRRPKVMVGRRSDGTFFVTDDRRVESHLTKVAKHMLWYPLVYIVLVLPMVAARFSAFSGAPVPFPVTITTAAVFMLHGFLNTVLFCTTRNILPGSWRHRFGLDTTWDGGRSDADVSSRPNPTWQFAGPSARLGTVGTGTGPLLLSVEKDVEIRYDDAQSSPSYLKYGSPSSPDTPTEPSPLLRTYRGGGGQRVDAHMHHIGPLSFRTPRDTNMSICIEVDGDDDNSSPSPGVHPASKAKTVELPTPPRSLGHSSESHESGMHGAAPGLEAPATVHLFATTPPTVNLDERQPHSLSISMSENTVDSARLSRPGADF
jgi:hypothetical protein